MSCPPHLFVFSCALPVPCCQVALVDPLCSFPPLLFPLRVCVCLVVGCYCWSPLSPCLLSPFVDEVLFLFHDVCFLPPVSHHPAVCVVFCWYSPCLPSGVRCECTLVVHLSGCPSSSPRRAACCSLRVACLASPVCCLLMCARLLCVHVVCPSIHAPPCSPSPLHLLTPPPLANLLIASLLISNVVIQSITTNHPAGMKHIPHPSLNSFVERMLSRLLLLLPPR